MPRPQPGTWISDRLREGYVALHRAGFAHSVEAWREGELVGGFYGVSIRTVFCGESMFALAPDASKVAFATAATALFASGCTMIDCQMRTDHLARFGGADLPRDDFLARLGAALGSRRDIDWTNQRFAIPALSPSARFARIRAMNDNQHRAEPLFAIDKDIPAGNIALDRIEGDTVYLHQELRDTDGPWFYWAFRVRGAEGRTLDFRFTESVAVGTCGPCVSLDRGATWQYAAEGKTTPNYFPYTFPADAHEVWFSQTIPYLQTNWESFLARHEADRGRLFETGVLCQSRKGRAVEKAVFGNLSGHPRRRFFLSARRHCGETMANYVLEGILECVFAPDDLGDWLRRDVEIMVVPFMDKDGCEDGDQGKNRRPHDHNRDYTDFLYPETRGIRDWIAERAGNVLDIFFDFHCPWLHGKHNESVYQVHSRDPENAERTQRFGRILEGLQSGCMAYREEDDIRWGVDWNTDRNYGAGRSVKRWAFEDLRCGFISSFEIPFATANGKTVTPDNCREFGRDVARAYRVFLTEANAGLPE